MSFPANVIPVFGSQRAYADLNFASGSFGLDGQIVNDPSLLSGWSFTRASTATYFGSDGLLKTASSGSPRFAYDPVTLASLGILVEEARTNLCLQSQTFDNASWAKTNATVSANVLASPDGTANADKLVESVATGQHRVDQAITVSNAAAYTFSVFAKADTRLAIALRIITGATNASAIFNLQAGTINITSAGTSSITAVGGGWYLCQVTGTTTSTSATAYINLQDTAGGTSLGSYTGDGTSGVYLWQAQLEAGAGASSPIPTTTAAVTRAADVAALTISGQSYPFTAVISGVNRAFEQGGGLIMQLDDGSASNRAQVIVNSGGTVQVNMTSAGAGQGVSTTAGALSVGTGGNVGARWATNSILAALNGTLATEDTAATVPAAPTTLRVASTQAGASHGDLTISRIRIYNRALSDAQLQSLTS